MRFGVYKSRKITMHYKLTYCVLETHICIVALCHTWIRYFFIARLLPSLDDNQCSYATNHDVISNSQAKLKTCGLLTSYCDIDLG